MRIYLVVAFFAFAVAASAAIDGTVTNGTTGKLQPGATVTLFQPTNQGPQFIDSVKTDAAGKFVITKEVPADSPGPLLLQAVYDGVQYNKMLPPGTPTTGVDIPVFDSSKQPGGAKIGEHIMLLEPDGKTLGVAESYVFDNEGKTTWNNPTTGTLQFTLPAAAEGKVEVNVLAPGGLPIRRAPDPAGKPNTFKLDFPIKPGQSEVRMEWSMPFTSGFFDDATIAKGVPDLKLLAPVGVTIKGDGVTALGQEPSTGATIYNIADDKYHIDVEGTGSIRNASGSDNSDSEDNGSPKVSENMPKLYGLTLATGDPIAPILAVKWILASVLGMLAIGFALLYRKGTPPNERDRS